MQQLILRRLLLLPVQLMAVFTLCFFLLRAVPGNPFEGDRKLPELVLKNLEERYRLSGPLHEQWVAFSAGAMTFDFGVSLKYRDRPVRDIIAETAPVSIVLGFISFALGLGLALIAGITSTVVMQSARSRWWDQFILVGASIFVALPKFLIGGLLVYIFSFHFRWLPPAQWGSPSQVIMPVLALALPMAASLSLLIRNALAGVLSSHYVRTGAAKGLSRVRLVSVHVLPNALHGVLAYLGPVFATLLTGSFIVEKIFAVPGMGRLFVMSVMDRDYTVVLGASVFFAAILILTNTVTDLIAIWIDPRLQERHTNKI